MYIEKRLKKRIYIINTGSNSKIISKAISLAFRYDEVLVASLNIT